MFWNMILKNMCNECWERLKWEKGIGGYIYVMVRLKYFVVI